MDAELLRTQIHGLEGNIKTLREREGVFLKRQGIKAQAEKLGQEADDYEQQAKDVKAMHAELVAEKNKALAATTGMIAERMNEALPVGTAIMQITDDQKIDIRWVIDGILRPYKALSGGEKVSFDCALALALGANIIIQEAAELDGDRMIASLQKLGEIDCQVICSTCHPIAEVPEPWKVVRL